LKIIIVAAFILTIFSCGNNKKDVNAEHPPERNGFAFIPTYQSILPCEGLDSIVLLFIQERPCADCIFELYIDKVYPTRTLITLKKRLYDNDYLKRSTSLFMINIHQKDFFVYSGLEDIFLGDKKLIRKRKEGVHNVYSNWGAILDSGKWTVNRNSDEFPFYPSEPIKFR
jgi:hypothetical protein